MSQRELAAAVGVPHSTIGRIEAGRVDPRVSSLANILDRLGFYGQVFDNDGRLLIVKEDRERLFDRGGRRFPAHLESGKTPDYFCWTGRQWWGWHNIAWPFSGEWVPENTYWRRRRLDYRTEDDALDVLDKGRVWDDAT